MDQIAGEIPIRYEEAADTYRISYDWWRDQSLTTAVVLAVGAITNTPPTEMEPIHNVVDADALDDLYAPIDETRLRRDGSSTSFRFHDCGVTVFWNGEIEIQPLGETDAEEVGSEA